MIRFHLPPPAPLDGGHPPVKIRVSSRRRPRGWLRRSEEYVREYYGDGLYEAGWTDRMAQGWVPISMKGREGPFCADMKRAVEFIMSDAKFQEDARGP